MDIGRQSKPRPVASKKDAEAIASILRHTKGKPPIDRMLALGAACPYHKEQRWERNAWYDEICRQETGGHVDLRQ